MIYQRNKLTPPLPLDRSCIPNVLRPGVCRQSGRIVDWRARRRGRPGSAVLASAGGIALGSIREDLLVDTIRHTGQKIPIRRAHDHAAEAFMDPGKGSELLSCAVKPRLPGEADTNIYRKPLAVCRFVHQLSGGPPLVWKHATAHQLQPDRAEVRNDQRLTQAVRQPLVQMCLLSGGHLDWMASLRRECAMRRDSIGGQEAALGRSGPAKGVRDLPRIPAPDPADH